MAQATVDLGLNTAAFTAGLNEAERRSQSFEGRIAGLFKRSPTQRAERAFTELATQLTSGNVAQAVAGFAARLTGIGGLFAGVAIGAAVGLFQKFRGEIEATDKAAKALGVELATLGGTRGPEEVAAKFKAISGSLDALTEKAKSTGNVLANFLDKYVNPVLGTGSRGRGAAQASEIEAGAKAMGKLLTDQARAEEAIAKSKVTALTVSQRDAQIEEVLASAAQKRSQIEEEATKFKLDLFTRKVAPKVRDPLIQASEEAAKKRKAAVITEAEAEIDAINETARIKEKQLQIDQNIAAQALLGISTEDQKISKLKQQLALLESQLQITTAIDKRQQIETSITQLKQQLSETQKARGPVTRAPIGIAAAPQGIYDPNTGEFRQILRPQEQANIRAGQAAAMASLRADQMQYQSDLRGWQARYEDYLRGADYYTPAQLKKPLPPPGYDVDPTTGQVVPRPQEGDITRMTKEELQSAMDAVLGKYLGA